MVLSYVNIPKFALLVLLSALGCTLIAQPVASFYATPLSGCNPLKVDFINQSQKGVSYLWKFGNGNESTLADPAAVYNNAGTYTVTLIATDASGVSDTIVLTDYITVFQSPLALFSKQSNSLCAGDSIQFMDNSVAGDGPIVSWKWDFGDGGTAYTTNPAYRYTLAGTYDVTLALIDSNGCQSTSKSVKFVEVHKLPELNFTSNLTSKCKAPLDVTFTAAVNGKGPFRYSWNFGDGQTSGQAAPKNTYASQGNYNVSLKVTDANGCEDSLSKSNLIKIAPPKADFVAGKLIICPGNTVSFTNTSTPMDGTGTWSWDFGNGTLSSLQDPRVTYKNPGLYSVTLTYRWDGCIGSETKTSYIKVNEAPAGKIDPSDVSLCRKPGDSMYFQASGKNIESVNWYLSDQHIISLPPSQPFRFPLGNNGTFILRASFTSADGCVAGPDTSILKIKGPVAAIGASPLDGCIPFSGTANWAGNSTSPIVSYEWSGLGGSGTGNPHNFTKSTFGPSKLSLKVTDADGCSDTASMVIDGGYRINPDLVVPPLVCRNQKFWIFNHSLIRHPDTVRFKYTWNGGSPLDLDIIDSAKKALLDSPNTEGFWGFEAHSHGCITKSSLKPKTRILGPKLDGLVKVICNNDSLFGINKSSIYTRTYWRYKNENLDTVFDATLKLVRPISQTSDLWLFAFNDTNNCSDSIDFKVSVDPVPARFTLDYNCGTQWLKTQNNYPGLSDTSFTWTLTNETTGSVQEVQSRHLGMLLVQPGKYRIDLSVHNPNFGCTPGNAAYVVVNRKPAGKPKVTIDRTSCYPVNLTLSDASYNQWASANWKVDGRRIPDSAANINHVFIGAADQFSVSLLRIDSAGCASTDTFIFKVNGIKAIIAHSQSGNLCNTATLTFRANIANPGAGPYTYAWDFGHKKSSQQKDTVHVKGYRAFPVSLTIKDDQGCASTTNAFITARNGSPIARFTVSDTTAACPPLDVFFTDITNASQYPIVKRFWDFGDNTYSNKEQPGKLYIYPGKYSVKLVVTNSVGCSDTAFIPNLVVVNGPNGTYSFDKKEGCTPLDLNLTTALTGKVKQLQFDMGDGAVLDLNENAHKYTRPGIYIPRLIIEDSNGCRFSPDPKDTIRVYANPKAEFDELKACDNKVYDIYHHSDMTSDSLTTIQWTLDGEQAGASNPLVLGFEGVKQRKLELLVTTVHGCTDKLERTIQFYSIEPALKADKQEYCLGESAFIMHTTTSDTTVIFKQLWLDNELAPEGEKVAVPADRRGKIPALLVVEDALGCRDTSYTPVFIKVGDTLPTVPLTMYRSSVVDNFTTETRFSESVEPDFKMYKLYLWMGNQWQLKASSENIKDTNLLVAGLNTLGNPYCHRISQLNYCGMETDSVALIPHCTVEVKAFGDTNQSVVKWTPYSGWSEVDRYRIWRKKSDENYYELIDSVAGNVVQYLDPSVYCHIVYDYRIEAVEKNGHREFSWSDTARSTPFHLLPVPAPEVWRTTVNDNQYTHTEWLTPVLPKFGVDYFTLYRDAGLGWEEYKDSLSAFTFDLDDHMTDVQSRTYSYAVQTTDKCGTKSPISNVGRSILLKVRPEGDFGKPMLRWTPYIFWNEGVQEYKVERSIGGNPFAEIGRVSGEVTMFEDGGLPPYCEKDFIYRVIAIRNQPDNYPDSTHNVESVSNHDKFLPPLRFFIPNAFTPNKNDLNEGFKPEGIYYYSYEMKIYNRYGQKLFDESYCQNKWNGIYNGEEAPDGVYAYYIKAIDLKGQEFIFTGTVHLMR